MEGLNGRIRALRQQDIMEPRETLGVVQCATGDETGHKEALIEKVTTLGNRLKATCQSHMVRSSNCSECHHRQYDMLSPGCICLIEAAK